MGVEVEHQPERNRFAAFSEGTESFLAYTPAGPGVVNLLSTWVHPAVRGHRVGETLVLAALDWARSEELEVIPTCWYVGTVVDRRPEYRDLLRG